jgi:copper chaperone CopZ
VTLQWAGPVLAALTLGTIGLGHVAVRRINYLYGTKPVPYVLALGLALLLGSLFVPRDLGSAALGILGMTTMWDSVELVRQEGRIRRGHAPENPERPVQARKEHRVKGGNDMGWFKRKQDTKTVELRVQDMRCANCEASVKVALRKVEGVQNVRVNRRQERVIVTVDATRPVTAAALIEAVTAVGYPAERA